MSQGEQGSPEPMDGATEKERFRTTVYLTEEELFSLDELKVIFRHREGRQIGRSEIIREAIRHYRAAWRER